MGGIRRKSNYQGLRKYNRIVSFLVQDLKKKKTPYNISEIRKLASSIYPNFKNSQYSKITKRSVVVGIKPKKSDPQPKKPTFPAELTNPSERYYWATFDMLLLIQNATLKADNLFFTSSIDGQENLEIQGGVPIEPDVQEFYKQNFKNFINFLDKKRKEDKIDLGSGSELRIIATEPVFINKRWNSEIVLVDQDGNSSLSEELNAQ